MLRADTEVEAGRRADRPEPAGALADEAYADLAPPAVELRAEGLSLRAIADQVRRVPERAGT